MDPSIPVAAVAPAAAAVTHPTDEGRKSDSGSQPMDIDGQWTSAWSGYRGVPFTLSVYDACVCAPSVCADEAVATGGCQPMHNAYGQQLCEVCETRLNRTKGKPYSCPPGLMCHVCYNKKCVRQAASKRTASANAETAALTPKRVRRTQSDPGEPIIFTRTRIRAEPPAAEPSKKTRVRTSAVDPSLLLDQTHVQRLALLAAVATDAALSHCVSNASAVVFVNDT